MNWEQIKKDYPKAYKLYDLRFEISALSDYYGGHHPNQRALYDFFDEQDLMIFTYYDKGNKDFHYAIYNPKTDEETGSIISLTGIKTRKDAETEAFEKGFEILESKLNKD